MNNKIPFAFYPSTEIHEEIINFSLPPAAQKLYSWLARRARPGTIQEFDKVDFDDYCNLMGRKPFSIQWFVSCFKKLIDTRLVRVVRQYRGYGFKVQVYHPWQVDEWIVDSDRSSNKNCDYSNKTFSNSNENFKKSTSNPDSSVPLYRENKEKQSKERTGSTVPKPIIRKIAAASLSEKNIHEPNSKGDFSVDTPNSSSSTPKNEFKGLKEDLKADSTTEIESTDIKTNIPRVDVKVNKKDKRTEFFLVQLDELGVVENATIRQAIKNYSDKQLNEAIALYRQRKREGYISNPCGYFIQALKENWAGQNNSINLDDSLDTKDKEALFRYWYDLAKELGYCTSVEERDGDRWVCLSGTWEKFSDAWERGYTLEYLRKVKKRTTNP